jgi:hypothetical protein
MEAIMPNVTEQEILARIAATRVMSELAAIVHESPEWHSRGLAFEALDRLMKNINQRRIFLKEKRRLLEMTIDERDSYIKLYSKYTDKSPLVDFAKLVQNEVQLALKDNSCDQSFADLKQRSVALAEIMSKDNQFNLNIECAINVALNAAIYQDMLNRLRVDLLTMKTEDLRQLLLSLGQEISSAQAKYGFMAEHAVTLQECYQMAMVHYAAVSHDQCLRSYVHEVSAKRGMPIGKLSRMIMG